MSRILIDTPAAATRLGLARATLAKLRVNGGGPPFLKLGAKVLYDETDLNAWIEAQPRHTSTVSVHATRLTAPAPTGEARVSTDARSKAKKIAARRRALQIAGKSETGSGR